MGNITQVTLLTNVTRYLSNIVTVMGLILCDTVEPVLRSPGLSGHLCITTMDTRSQIFSHTNICIVVCIKRSPV